MPKSDRSVQIGEVIQKLAAEFINRESNRVSLITVTNVDIAKDFGNAVILFTVLPDHKDNEVLDFLKRRRKDFREYVKKNSKLKRLPRFTFEIDRGELNRQHIDNLLQQ